MQLYSPIIIKLALGIICLVIQINLMGKGNLAPTSAMDQVQNYVLGGIIGGVIYNDSITVLQFVMVLIIWTLLVLILKYAKEHNRYIKMMVDGKPIPLIENGRLKVKDCLRSGISANELMFKLRSNGVYEIEQVKRAVLEQNGQLTIMEFGDENIRYPIIVDGQANLDVLELISKDESWLLEQANTRGFDKIGDVYLGEYVSGKLNLYGYFE
ncbi:MULTISPECIES: DUF421 domain-containing protein [unclassified Enterococcus]|uniref:DUF421 domain-containing protein n=1 Tax=unclassified Enterococcus TaxID=2608891 RepID=UPI0015523E2E|nr:MULTISPECIES: DUF421 domain-containing protein [unclassified Enterococcus]MBS7577848.1 DUF421 domain-containing protein [Enterococcus sp. MMGLQ5-2]MBS7585108.1 DUF421 domain-containing protein [Enterococcus sp. MMGLQ5-1]NPD12964.1 DUF421 domain-containing protein [Enterococcus sp. MMGLQ5-1]NPD37678.1 DUF421 domain-containing protein [Enterococcus sp. MMGLQ5-2]